MRGLHGLDRTQRALGEKLLTVSVWSVAVLVGIDAVGIDLTTLTVFSGAFGLAVGFGLAKTFGNLIAGVILLMDRSIKPGDVIAVNDNEAARSASSADRRARGFGDNARRTRDPDSQRNPDDNAGRELVVLIAAGGDRRLPLGVAYGSDIELAESCCCKPQQPFPACSRTLRLGTAPRLGQSIELHVAFHEDPENGIGDVYNMLKAASWATRQRVEIPFPQSDAALQGFLSLRRLAKALARSGANAGADKDNWPLPDPEGAGDDA